MNLAFSTWTNWGEMWAAMKSYRNCDPTAACKMKHKPREREIEMLSYESTILVIFVCLTQ
jgi:hypothetical protein